MSEQAVWKTVLVPNGADPTIVITLPRAAQPLTLQLQHGAPTVWWRVTPGEPLDVRHFRVIGTGWKFDGHKTVGYIGTWLEGDFVWHLFEVHAP